MPVQATTPSLAALRSLAQASRSQPAPSAAAAAAPSGRGWDRGQVTVKLTGRRKALLADIALGMAKGATPSDALDRAIESAWTSRDELASLERRLEAIEDAVEAADGERRREAAEARAALARLSDGVERLHGLIGAFAEPA